MPLTALNRPRSRKTLRQLMSQSTIYQRNEARRIKTIDLKDDPRPAMIRVLSGLPGFRIFMSPDQPYRANTVAALPVVVAAAVSTAVAFHDNVYTSYSTANDTAIEASAFHRVAVVAASAGVGGALSVFFVGANPASPFAVGAVASSIVRQGQVVPVYAAAFGPVASPFQVPSLGWNFLGFRIATRALSTSFLFGSKILVEQSLGARGDGASMATVVSSGVAGGVLGLSKFLTGSRIIWASEIVGATMYFTSYETIKSLLSRQEGNKTLEPSKFAIATAGAIAGVLYESVRMYGATAVRSRLSSVPQSQSLLSTTVLRAAPAHALLFVGYEATLGLLAPQHR